MATLVWQRLTNKDIALVLRQLVKNYLRTGFDKLGVWTRLELALYVAGHGGANWHLQLGNGLWSPSPPGRRLAAGDECAAYADAETRRGQCRQRREGLARHPPQPVRNCSRSMGGQRNRFHTGRRTGQFAHTLGYAALPGLTNMFSKK
ncbi:MAG TPA: hypothetical protein VIX14_06410 [Terriglobales bacterium]